jgi:inosine-uridine nucleoside N-ribohydrolase
VRLWIDTDVGSDPDDAVALLCAASHPRVDLVGVSTVDGDTEWRAEIARNLVDAPVVAGDEMTAAQVGRTDPDALLAIGPLTNVARLLAARIVPSRLGVMGGLLKPVRHRGAVWEIEHNFGTAPEAARLVIEHAPGVLLCPLDVTVRMRPSTDDLRRMVETAPALGPMFDDWVAQVRAEGAPGDEAVVRLHDPLALLALVGEPVVTIERRTLTVDDQGRVHEDPGRGRRVDTVTDANVADALARIVTLVAQGSRRGR